VGAEGRHDGECSCWGDAVVLLAGLRQVSLGTAFCQSMSGGAVGIELTDHAAIELKNTE
jgi:hypothetical protein